MPITPPSIEQTSSWKIYLADWVSGTNGVVCFGWHRATYGNSMIYDYLQTWNGQIVLNPLDYLTVQTGGFSTILHFHGSGHELPIRTSAALLPALPREPGPRTTGIGTVNPGGDLPPLTERFLD
jgi:hypothetical protein